MCEKKFQSPCVCRNERSNPRVCKLDTTSFTDYSKATRVKKFYTAYTWVYFTYPYSKECPRTVPILAQPIQ